MTRAHLNDVEADPAAELEAIAAAGAAAQSDELEAEVAAAGHDPEAWLEGAGVAVEFLSAKVCPAWELGTEHKGELAKRLARVLDHYLPGAVAGVDNWHPLWQLGASLAMVTAACGFDYQRMQLKPLHPPKKGAENDAEGETTGRVAPVHDGGEPERQNVARFTMGGG